MLQPKYLPGSSVQLGGSQIRRAQNHCSNDMTTKETKGYSQTEAEALQLMCKSVQMQTLIMRCRGTEISEPGELQRAHIGHHHCPARETLGSPSGTSQSHGCPTPRLGQDPIAVAVGGEKLQTWCTTSPLKRNHQNQDESPVGGQAGGAERSSGGAAGHAQAAAGAAGLGRGPDRGAIRG